MIGRLASIDAELRSGGGMNYWKAQTLMASARFPHKGKPIGNNTRLYFTESTFSDGNYYSVRLHGNEILRIYRDRFVPMDAGWRTVTTKARLNEFMPVGYVCQRNWDWYLTIGDTTYDWGDVYFISTRDENYGEVMLYSTHPKWPSQVQEVEE